MTFNNSHLLVSKYSSASVFDLVFFEWEMSLQPQRKQRSIKVLLKKTFIYAFTERGW